MAPLNSAMAQSDECLLQTPSLEQRPVAAPIDVCGIGGAAQASDDDFYALAWRTFKFLVWPAASGHRGTSDTTKDITSMQGPRVFETFKASWEIFRPDAERPVAWKDYPSRPCNYQLDLNPDALVLGSFSKFGPVTTGGRSNSHVLVAQNRTYVRYLAGYNEVIFDSIVGNRLYDASDVSRLHQPADLHEAIDTKAKSPDGAMIVKSAWIELGGRIDQSKFYVRHDALVEDPETNECRKADVALVGLHVAHKTKSRPQWIWSTFEHVDNVPEPGDEPGKRYTFNNGNRSMPMPAEVADDFKLPRPPGTRGPGAPPTPYQVERLQMIDAKVREVNRVWQGELRSAGSVWQNYKLIMSQWPLLAFTPDEGVGLDAMTPMPACDAASRTPATANTTMETFQQRCEPKLTCMGCHNESRITDFIWAIRLNRYTPPAFNGPIPRENAINKLQEILGKEK
jgi:hypothetical protein